MPCCCNFHFLVVDLTLIIRLAYRYGACCSPNEKLKNSSESKIYWSLNFVIPGNDRTLKLVVHRIISLLRN